MGGPTGVRRRGRRGHVERREHLRGRFRIDAFFFAFILGTLILDVALLALTIVIARTFRGRYRLLALIPAGTVAAILLFVVAGGPIMLVTWLAAAAAAVLTSGRAPMQARPTTP